MTTNQTITSSQTVKAPTVTDEQAQQLLDALHRNRDRQRHWYGLMGYTPPFPNLGEVPASDFARGLEMAAQVDAEWLRADAEQAAAAAAEAEARTPRARFERIAAAIKAGLRSTDRGEPATPAAYAEAKAAAAADAEMVKLRREGEKEARAADTRRQKAIAAAVDQILADPPTPPTDKLREATGQALDAIATIRRLDREHAAAVAMARKALLDAGAEESGFSVPASGTGVGDGGAVYVEGTVYGPGAARPHLDRIAKALPHT